MGFLDLSTTASAKKHVDFNDARYQLADKLRWNGKQTTRSTFTLYDSRDENKVSVQDIAAAYALSDKKLPMGELLNKMVDLIMDMEDGKLDTEKDAVYTWKYSNALITMYEDKVKRQEPLSVFDNGLKTLVINSRIFNNRYPNKYTGRTNFFDNKTKEAFAADIVETFKDVALPGIHDSAIRQSKEIAERHNNPILDRIVNWAVENYKCEVDSFFEVKEDGDTHLFFSTNTIILHLKNGYDMSIIGYVGTDHDDQFAISILDAHNISISQHNERISQDKLKDALSEASARAKIDPLTTLLKMEKKKNLVLKQQYDILIDIRPMVPADVLDLQAAESVVGHDYIWGCKQFRERHEDLPRNFKLSDIKLPQFEEDEKDLDEKKQQVAERDLDAIADNMITQKVNAGEVEASAKSMIGGAAEPTSAVGSIKQPAAVKESKEPETQLPTQDIKSPTLPVLPVVPEVPAKPTTAEELVQVIDIPANLFDPEPEQKKVEEKKFADPEKNEFEMPTLTLNTSTTIVMPGVDPNKKEKDYDPMATLLPGVVPVKQVVEEDVGTSFTQEARPVPTLDNTPRWKAPEVEEKPKTKVEKPVEEILQPELLFDNIDDLFA